MLGDSCSAATFRRAPVAFLAPSKTEYLALAPLPLVCVIVSSRARKRKCAMWSVCYVCLRSKWSGGRSESGSRVGGPSSLLMQLRVSMMACFGQHPLLLKSMILSWAGDVNKSFEASPAPELLGTLPDRRTAFSAPLTLNLLHADVDLCDWRY